MDQPSFVPKVPKSPECYASAHSNRIKTFPEEDEEVVNPRTLKNQPQDDEWRHELDHDVESVFWLLLYWAMVSQPEGSQKEPISPQIWTDLLGDFEDRDRLVSGLSAGNPPKNLTHSVYKPLWPLISKLAAILVVDRHWLPKSSRKHEEYICEAFQRLILQFIVSNRDEDFMTRPVGDSLRQVPEIAKSGALVTTPISLRDSLERGNEVKRRRLEEPEVGCVSVIFEFVSFLLLMRAITNRVGRFNEREAPVDCILGSCVYIPPGWAIRWLIPNLEEGAEMEQFTVAIPDLFTEA